MPYTILNVDDREESLYLRTRTLRSAGFTVVEASTGTAAIKAASEHSPQVILLDVHLPDIDGLEVCRRVKANPATATIQILHVSATAASEFLQAMGLENGADGYLIEPCDPGVLIATVRALVRQWQKQEDLRKLQAELEAERRRTTFARLAAEFGVWDWNFATGELHWCEELDSVFGREDDAPMNMQRWSEFVYSEDRSTFDREIRRGSERGGRLHVQHRILRNGETRWLECIGENLLNSDGSRSGVVTGIVMDVTDIKRVERELQESEERFRMATEAAHEAIWELHVATGEVSWSNTYTTMFGRPNEETSLDWWTEHIHPHDRKRVRDCFDSALSGTAKAWECEYRFLKADGTWANVFDRAFIARDDKGTAFRVIGAMLDTTELNVVQQRLRLLTGLLPICAWCKKIKDRDGDWHVLEKYIHDHSEAEFSHGMCPECATKWNLGEA